MLVVTIKSPPRDRRVERAKAPAAAHAPKELTVTIGMLKWVGGSLMALLLAYGAWKVVWDDIKTYWRQEAVQVQKDKEVDTAIKTQAEKAAAELKHLATKAELGRAWLLFGLSDFKSEWREQLLDDCKEKKKADCSKYEAKVTQARVESSNAKQSALEAGKDK